MSGFSFKVSGPTVFNPSKWGDYLVLSDGRKMGVHWIQYVISDDDIMYGWTPASIGSLLKIWLTEKSFSWEEISEVKYDRIRKGIRTKINKRIKARWRMEDILYS